MFIERKIDSLYGLIVVKRVEGSPVMLHCATYPKENHMEVEQYVRLNALPIKLSTQIRDFVAKAWKKEADKRSLETKMEFRKIREEERKMEEENNELGIDAGRIEKRTTSV